MGTHRYPEEFRREAVELYRSSGRPRCRVAESLGVSDGSLAAWVAEFDAGDEPGALSGDERAELARLRKELLRSLLAFGSTTCATRPPAC